MPLSTRCPKVCLLACRLALGVVCLSSSSACSVSRVVFLLAAMLRCFSAPGIFVIWMRPLLPLTALPLLPFFSPE